MEFILANRSWLLFALGVTMMIVILMRRYMRHFGPRRGTAPAHASAPHALSQPLLDAPADVTRWQVEMHEIMRDAKAELDTKIAVLQKLVVDAERQSQRLEAALARRQER
ncbi:MAG: hypothetical protein KDA41_14955 [Planctomycetales bacterium]|nr:hypothetical protein [Planctomycetales bacterium]